jgi:flagellar motility protein MotE (MotC chaperone)
VKKMIVMGGLVLVLFGISAGASWFLQQDNHSAADHAEADPFADKQAKAGAHQGGSFGGAADVRPAVRPPFNQSADDAAQLAANLRNQMEALRTREQQFTVRQKSLEIIYQDIRSERAAIDELRKQLNDEMKALADKLDSLERKSGEMQQKSKQLTEQNKELSQTVLRIEEVEKENIKRLAAVYDAMDAEAAAQHLQHMADTGKIETAVKILGAMRERQAAKIFAAFPDRTTVVQILEKLKSVDRQPNPTKGGP